MRKFLSKILFLFFCFKNTNFSTFFLLIRSDIDVFWSLVLCWFNFWCFHPILAIFENLHLDVICIMRFPVFHLKFFLPFFKFFSQYIFKPDKLSSPTDFHARQQGRHVTSLAINRCQQQSVKGDNSSLVKTGCAPFFKLIHNFIITPNPTLPPTINPPYPLPDT